VTGRTEQHVTMWELFNLGSPEDTAWQLDALCAQTDPEMFHPDKGGTIRQAKAVCLACLVRTDCLDYALEHNGRIGIWGGLSSSERAVLRRSRAAVAGSGEGPARGGEAA
jgi:WhiB family redox-sensing transcriptional regulator